MRFPVKVDGRRVEDVVVVKDDASRNDLIFFWKIARLPFESYMSRSTIIFRVQIVLYSKIYFLLSICGFLCFRVSEYYIVDLHVWILIETQF